jgi:hypothetical protein
MARSWTEPAFAAARGLRTRVVPPIFLNSNHGPPRRPSCRSEGMAASSGAQAAANGLIELTEAAGMPPTCGCA